MIYKFLNPYTDNSYDGKSEGIVMQREIAISQWYSYSYRLLHVTGWALATAIIPVHQHFRLAVV